MLTNPAFGPGLNHPQARDLQLINDGILTKQQVFDKVVAGMAAQNWVKSLNASGGCSFRGANGTKCAVGHILPDHLVFSALNSFGSVLNMIPGMDKNEHYGLLRSLMQAHDGSHDASEMKRSFVNVANHYGLDPRNVQ